MLQHDYLLEIISQFVDVATAALRGAVMDGDVESAGQAEDAIAGLLDLDPEVALQLSPDSLVTMMLLSGVADSLAGYVAYTLRRLSGAYAGMGRAALAELRLAQARAVEESFGCEPGAVPEEFASLDAELS
ncbi:hypothetical protein [uncultured Olsenella sp.]|uniref:hypothetical protein n=1 Tax=uncultured Olsenella sp. TaxID=190764 RepID=UPI0026DC212F|nr:hypothetical protein [uncultured Olsenella sp.]